MGLAKIDGTKTMRRMMERGFTVSISKTKPTLAKQLTKSRLARVRLEAFAE